MITFLAWVGGTTIFTLASLGLWVLVSLIDALIQDSAE